MILEIYRAGIVRNRLLRTYDEYPVSSLQVGDQMIVWDGNEDTYSGIIDTKVHDLTNHKVKVYLRSVSKYKPPKEESDDDYFND